MAAVGVYLIIVLHTLGAMQCRFSHNDYSLADH